MHITNGNIGSYKIKKRDHPHSMSTVHHRYFTPRPKRMRISPNWQALKQADTRTVSSLRTHTRVQSAQLCDSLPAVFVQYMVSIAIQALLLQLHAQQGTSALNIPSTMILPSVITLMCSYMYCHLIKLPHVVGTSVFFISLYTLYI